MWLRTDLIHWPQGDVVLSVTLISGHKLGAKFMNTYLRWMAQNTSIMVQLMAWWHQAVITWENVDPELCRHMASLGYDLES